MNWFVLISWMPRRTAGELDSGGATATPGGMLQGKKTSGAESIRRASEAHPTACSTPKAQKAYFVVDRDAKVRFWQKNGAKSG
jgi:hypothetical protein